MSNLRSKVRELIREELDIRTGRSQPPANSVYGYMNKFLRNLVRGMAKELQAAYDIEFSDTILGDRSFQTDFEVYNQRQDRFMEGQVFIWVKDGEVTVQAQGGPLGSSVSEQQTFIDRTFGYGDVPFQEIDFQSAFQTLAGRP